MFANCYKNKKVLITGNTGFKGSWLTLWLLSLGAEVFGISKDIQTSPSLFEILKLQNKINFYQEDILDYPKISELIYNIKPDFVFHLAAQAIVSKSFLNPLETLKTNIIGTANILESLRNLNNPCNVIIITSDKCYENEECLEGYRETDRLGGKDLYSASKASAELVIKAYFNSFFSKPDSKVRIVSARAGNVIGGGDWAPDRIIPDCVREWSQNKAVNIRNPNSTRPWQHVLEPLSGYLQVGYLLSENLSLNGESFNFGPLPEQCKPVLELIKDISSYWNIKENIFNIVSDNKFPEARLLKLNCEKALTLLNWQPTLTYQETVKFTSQWYLHFYKNDLDIKNFTLNQIHDYQNIAQKRKLEWSR